jgi:hypothetical protein
MSAENMRKLIIDDEAEEVMDIEEEPNNLVDEIQDEAEDDEIEESNDVEENDDGEELVVEEVQQSAQTDMFNQNPIYQPLQYQMPRISSPAPEAQSSAQKQIVQQENAPGTSRKGVSYRFFNQNDLYTRERLNKRCRTPGCGQLIYRNSKGNFKCWHCNAKEKKSRQRVIEQEQRRIDHELELRIEEEEVHFQLYNYSLQKVTEVKNYVAAARQETTNLKEKYEAVYRDLFNTSPEPLFRDHLPSSSKHHSPRNI